MSDFQYSSALGKYLAASINLPSDTIRAALVVTGGTHYNGTATNVFFNTIASADVLGTSSAITGIGTTSGSFTASNIAFIAVTSSSLAASAIVLYKDTGTSSTSPLLAYIDDYSGLPITPNGQNINITWPSNFIFKI